MQMKTITGIGGILVVLSIQTALGQDAKTDLSANGQGVKLQTVNPDLLSAAPREKLAKLFLSEKAPDRIVGKRFVFSGPLIALIKSDDPFQTFNPLAVSNAGAQLDNVRLDPYLPPPRGFTLFRLEF